MPDLSEARRRGLLMAPLPTEEQWGVVWKPDGKAFWHGWERTRELSFDIGIANSVDEITNRIVKKCVSSREWAARYSGGRFYPFPIHAIFTPEQALHGGP